MADDVSQVINNIRKFIISNKIEGVSVINHKNKDVIYISFTEFGMDKKKALKLIKDGEDVYKQFDILTNKKAALCLSNVAELHFDMDMLSAFKVSQTNSKPYQKKVALIGVQGLLKVAYNFVVGLTDGSMKAFSTREEALEWLTKD